MDINLEKNVSAVTIKQDENDNTTSAQSSTDARSVKRHCTNGLKMEHSSVKDETGDGVQASNNGSQQEVRTQNTQVPQPSSREQHRVHQVTDDNDDLEGSKEMPELKGARVSQGNEEQADISHDDTLAEVDFSLAGVNVSLVEVDTSIPEVNASMVEANSSLVEVEAKTNNQETAMLHNIPLIEVDTSLTEVETSLTEVDTSLAETDISLTELDTSNESSMVPKETQANGQDTLITRCTIDNSNTDKNIAEDLQRSPSPEEIIVMEGIFEPRPSTSRDSGINRIGSPGSGSGSIEPVAPEKDPVPPARPPLTVSLSASAQDKRQQLKFLPRTSQYEKHPLLQIRSDSGMSEFEMLLLERESKHSASVDTKMRTFSLDESGHAQINHRPVQRRLEPRGAHMEKNALFQKNASGLYELEQYLLEREQELGETSSTSQEVSCASAQSGHSIISVPVTTSSTTAESGFGTLSESSNLSIHTTTEISSLAQIKSTKSEEITSADVKPRRPPMQHSKSISEASLPSRRMTLQPRRIQYEKHPLLETRDDSGMSEIDHFLKEKENEIQEKGKCSTKCTCKNVNCIKCKGASPRLLTKEVDMVTRIEPKMNNKRVHFQRQDCVELSPERHKSDSEDTEDSGPNIKSQQPATPVEAASIQDNTPDGTTEAAHAVKATVTEPPPGIEELTTQSQKPITEQDNQLTESDHNVKDKSKSSRRKAKRHKSVCTLS